jgi:hypothetical protein
MRRSIETASGLSWRFWLWLAIGIGVIWLLDWLTR